MSPVGKEMHYKNGMKKDPDGFTDIDWCSSAVLNSWDDLRRAFMAANARKAIAPTQVSCRAREGTVRLVGGFGGGPHRHNSRTEQRKQAQRYSSPVYASVLTAGGLGQECSWRTPVLLHLHVRRDSRQTVPRARGA